MKRTCSVLDRASLALLLLVAPKVAQAAADLILQNDSFTTGASAGFQSGFVAGEIGAVRLIPPGPGPTPVTRVQLLFGGAATTQTITLWIWDDSAGTLSPGAVLYSGDYQLTGSDAALQEIDLTGLSVSVSGPFRVGIEFQHGGTPSIARDADGTNTAGRNFIYVAGGPWYDSGTLGVTGDWIIRAGVAANPTIFTDGFESGGLGAWSSAQTAGGDLSVSDAARMAGTDYGLQAVVNDTSPAFVQDDLPNHELRYRARFYFDPNGFDPGEAQSHLRTRIFLAFASPSRRVAAIVLRRQGGAYSLLGRARLDDNSQANTGFSAITDGPHYVELDLKPSSSPDANDGSLQMWIDGIPAGSRTGLDNSNAFVDFVRMGALSLKTGASGTLFWDEFKSTTGAAIGP